MKILQLFDFFSIPHGGGSVDIVYRLSQTLAQRGHETTIYTSDFELDQEYIDSLQGVKVYPFHSWLNLLRMPLVPGLVTEVKRTLKEFDIVHLHQYRSFQNIVIHHYAKRYGVPYVINAHGSLTTFFYRRWLKWIFDALWGHRILKDASRVLAVTPMEAEQYKSMGINEHKIEIVPSGLNLSEFDNLPARGGFREKYGLNANQRIILYLGRIHKIKGLDLLIKVFAHLSKEPGNARLVIAGPDDGYLPSLRKLITELKLEEKVFLTGPLYGQEKLNAYVDADVYVLPSHYEIFGITIIEAMACGAPVVVTDRCGIADDIDGETGLVVPYDREQLQRALLKMLGDEKLRLQFGEKGKLLVREKFNWDKIVGRVEGIYQSVLTRASEKTQSF